MKSIHLGRWNQFDSKFTELTNLLQAAKAGMDSCATVEQYKQQFRIPINFKMLEIILGAEFTDSGKKGQMKVKYNDTRCTINDLDRVVKVLSDFINHSESRFLDSFVVQQGGMDIPNYNWYDSVVLLDGKLSKKDMRNTIFGYEGKIPVCQMFLTELDIMTIAANAEILRKKMLRNEILLAVGITLVVAAAAAGTVYYVKSKKDEEAEGLCIDVDPDLGPGIAEIEDAPVVVDIF